MSENIVPRALYIVSRDALNSPKSYRVMCEIVSHSLDSGEEYPVPLDYKLVDMVLPEYSQKAIWKALEQAGFTPKEWKLMTYWQPETDGVEDTF